MRNTLELGLRHYSRKDLEAVKAAGADCGSRCWGWRPSTKMSRRNSRVETIESITVLGALQASKAVKAALQDRIS